MIIQCINCNKKFSVNSELIPNKGRTIQCGSCNHIWFFNKYEQDKLINLEKDQRPKQLCLVCKLLQNNECLLCNSRLLHQR